MTVYDIIKTKTDATAKLVASKFEDLNLPIPSQDEFRKSLDLESLKIEPIQDIDFSLAKGTEKYDNRSAMHTITFIVPLNGESSKLNAALESIIFSKNNVSIDIDKDELVWKYSTNYVDQRQIRLDIESWGNKIKTIIHDYNNAAGHYNNGLDNLVNSIYAAKTNQLANFQRTYNPFHK